MIINHQNGVWVKRQTGRGHPDGAKAGIHFKVSVGHDSWQKKTGTTGYSRKKSFSRSKYILPPYLVNHT